MCPAWLWQPPALAVVLALPTSGPAGAGAALGLQQPLEDEGFLQPHLRRGMMRKELWAPNVILGRAWGQIFTGDSPRAEPWLSPTLSVGEGARCRGTIIASFFF